MRRLTFPQATHFVLHNRHDLAAFCSRYRVAPERVEVIPLGSLDLFREWITHPVAQDDRTVLFFGRLSPYKGLDILYKAAPEIARQVPGLRIVIAGKPVAGYMPPQPPALTNGGRVEVIERHIPNTLLAQLFQQATLVVCPYVDATQSGVVLTAYAFRRPVVASRAGGLPEYVQDGTTGYLVPPADAPALAQAIIRLLKEPGTRSLTSKWQHEKMDMPLPWTAIARQEVKLCSRILT